MKAKRFSAEHIAGILKQAELGTPVGELCRQHGISEQSYYRWKKIYGNMEPSQAKELRQMRDENTKLKRIVGGSLVGQGYAPGCSLKKKF
jgi:putative transposase